MSKRSNLILGLMAGASFALGYWLNSDKGRAFQKDAQDTVNDAYGKGSATAKNAIDKTSNMIHEVIDAGVDVMKKAQVATNNTTQKAKDALKS